MKTKTIGILGGKGLMAQWFIRHFGSEFKEVLIFDLDSTLSLKEFVQASDILLVSVPISKTVRLIEDVGQYCRSDQLILDFTSLKEASCKAMKEIGCAAIGLHPLFGPQTEAFDQFGMVLCEVNQNNWTQKIKNLFENRNLQVIEMIPKEHDQMMAYIQALNHGLQLICGDVLSKQDTSKLQALKTPSFSFFLKGIQNIIQNNANLYFELASHNPYFLPALKEFSLSMEKYIELIENKDQLGFEKLFNKLKKKFSLKEAL